MPPPTLSNTERQRQFRERNPGYYGRLHRKRNAGMARLCAQQVALHARQEVSVVARVPLMLPAPEQASNFDGVLLLQQFEAEVARHQEACEAAYVLIERNGAEAQSKPLHLPTPVV